MPMNIYDKATTRRHFLPYFSPEHFIYSLVITGSRHRTLAHWRSVTNIYYTYFRHCLAASIDFLSYAAISLGLIWGISFDDDAWRFLSASRIYFGRDEYADISISDFGIARYTILGALLFAMIVVTCHRWCRYTTTSPLGRLHDGLLSFHGILNATYWFALLCPKIATLATIRHPVNWLFSALADGYGGFSPHYGYFHSLLATTTFISFRLFSALPSVFIWFRIYRSLLFVMAVAASLYFHYWSPGMPGYRLANYGHTLIVTSLIIISFID
jgi:hypothetical protein